MTQEFSRIVLFCLPLLPQQVLQFASAILVPALQKHVALLQLLDSRCHRPDVLLQTRFVLHVPRKQRGALHVQHHRLLLIRRNNTAEPLERARFLAC